MKSARRKKFARRWRKAKSDHDNGRVFGIFMKLLIPIILILGMFLFVKLRTIYWNGHDKVAFAFRLTGGDVAVTVADPKLEELTTLVIPGDTQVDVAENYGTFRIKNVWQLSQNEKLKGRLLPETVTQNFLFPVFLWSGFDGVSISKFSLSGVLQFIFNPQGGTNIPFGDRVSISLFALNVPSLGRTEINLGESQYLRKQKLDDGESGYILTGPAPERLTVYFSDNDLSVAGSKVSITDATGSPGVADKVGQIVEVLGGKVVTVDKKTPVGSDCSVSGGNSNLVRKVSTLFTCTKSGGKSDFDLEINLGQNFAKRF